MKFAYLILITLFSMNVHAEEAAESNFVSDRPGATDDPHTMKAGQFRIESSLYDWTKDKNEIKDTTTEVLGNIVFVAGISDNAEIQLGVDSYLKKHVIENGDTTDTYGTGDSTLRLKYNLIGNSGGDFALALLPRVSYLSKLNDSKWEGGLGIPMDFALSHGFDFSITPQWNAVHDEEGNNRNEFFLGAVLEYEMTPSLSAGVQLVNKAREKAAADTSTGVDAAYKVTQDLQIDIGAEFGLANVSADYRVLGGFTYRFGKE